MTSSRDTVAILAMLLALAACGGGGSANPSPLASSGGAGTPAPAPAPSPSPAPSPAPVPSSAPAIGQAEQVNTATAGDQTNPVVASLAGGGYAVAWNSAGNVIAQRYDAQDRKNGGEITVFTDKLLGGLAGLADGSIVVTAATSGTANLFAQRLDASGNSTGAASTVTSGADASVQVQGGPVLVQADGSWLATWRRTQTAQPAGTWVQAFDPGGNASGQPFSVAAAADYKDIVQAAGGNIVTSWTSTRTYGGGEWAVTTPQGQGVVDSYMGAAPGSGNFDPHVAALADGTFVLAWKSIGASAAYWVAQRYDAGGHALGSAVPLDFSAATSFRLTGLQGSGFLMTWVDPATGHLMARYFGVDLQPAGEAFEVAAAVATPTPGIAPAYSILPTVDGFVAVYEAAGTEGNEIYRVRFTR